MLCVVTIHSVFFNHIYVWTLLLYSIFLFCFVLFSPMCLVVFLNVEVSIIFFIFSVKWCCLCILFNSCCSCRSVASSCFGFLMNSCWLSLSVNLFCALQRTHAVHAYLLSVNLFCALQRTHAVHAYLLSVNLCLCITVNSCCSRISVISEPVFVHYSELLLYMHFSEIAFCFCCC